MRIIYEQRKQRVPVKAWLDDLDPSTEEQALNLARLPFAHHHVALMPDAHHGYGMPIGGVLASAGYVVPNAIGVDIGCGMHSRRTNIEVGRLTAPGAKGATLLRAALDVIQSIVPTGNGPIGSHKQPRSWDSPLDDPEVVALLDCAPEELQKAWEASRFQIGTLGGGKVNATLAQ